jgi:membrane-bound lytic murein transglycosylase B
MDGDETRGLESKRLRPAAPTAPEAAAVPETSTDKAAPTDQPAPAESETKAEQPAGTGPTIVISSPRHGFRDRYGHALRRLPGPGTAARRFGSWSRRPTGRLTITAVLLLVAIAGTAAAGALLVPATGRTPVAAPVSASPTASGALPTDLTTALPSAPPAIGGTFGPTTTVVQRPADVLKPWAAQLTARVGVPQIALEAYGYAELVLGRTNPTCGLKWTTLAAIGKVESNHGSANNSTLLADGRTLPTILGAPLNGTGGTLQIPDTDQGTLDGDRTWDRAVGPMQFIPSTWEGQAVDADNDGMRDPSDIDDAALAAANYLCRGGRNLTDIGDWWAAILTYNDVQPYAQDVYLAANEYGSRSRT